MFQLVVYTVFKENVEQKRGLWSTFLLNIKKTRFYVVCPRGGAVAMVFVDSGSDDIFPPRSAAAASAGCRIFNIFTIIVRF